MSEMHKVSASFKNVSSSEPSTKGSAKRLLMKLLTKDNDGNYPWQYPFEHDSFPDRVWGPYKDFPAYLLNIDVNGEQKPPGPWSAMTVEDFRDWFHRDDKITALIDEAMQQKPGKRAKTDIVDNINNKRDSPTGTSKDATLRRLRKDHPEQYQRVLNGELSANKAAIEAGFRRQTVQITDADPVAAANRIREKLGDDFANQLKRAL
jgi:hypothetical protein